MNLENHKILYVTITAILALLIASPALQHFLVYPQTDYFTELWLLGPNQKAENYPYNITQNTNYQVYLGVSNRLGTSAYYKVEVKLSNQIMYNPDTFQRTPSNLPALYSFNLVVANQQNVQTPINFVLNYDQADSQVNFNYLTINDDKININNYATEWNSTTNDYYANLVFELWRYNSSTGNFQYHERFVNLRLNCTV